MIFNSLCSSELSSFSSDPYLVKFWDPAFIFFLLNEGFIGYETSDWVVLRRSSVDYSIRWVCKISYLPGIRRYLS